MIKQKSKFTWLNYFRPTSFYKTIYEINLFTLSNNGIKLVICDLDNTLSPHFSRWPNRKVINFCESIKQNGMKLAIVSNNTKKRVNEYVSKLKVDFVIPSAKKPFKRKIVKLINKLNLTPEEVIVIGDQFITDILVANRIGTKSILVLPVVDPSKDVTSNALTRFLERFVYKKLAFDQKTTYGNLDEDEISDELEYI